MTNPRKICQCGVVVICAGFIMVTKIFRVQPLMLHFFPAYKTITLLLLLVRLGGWWLVVRLMVRVGDIFLSAR